MKKICFSGVCLLAVIAAFAGPFDAEIDALVRQMTVEEKCALLKEASPAIPRLGIPAYDWWNEALHGVARNGRATVFPQSIALAASFDTNLMYEVASAIGDEMRVKFRAGQRLGRKGPYSGLHVCAPNINIFRDPRWGRGMETFGEDVELTTAMGTAFVRGIQGDHPKYLKVAACLKHFAVHSGPEAKRHVADYSPTKEDLYGTYLPAFRNIIAAADPALVMSAYNRVYGESASSSKYLLTDILRGEFGFRGAIISDADSVNDIWKTHKLEPDAAHACARAIKAGVDIELGWARCYDAMPEAVRKGLVSEREIDIALHRTLEVRFRMGILGHPTDNPYDRIPESVLCSDAHHELARRAARAGMVLLKNARGALPIRKDIPKLGVGGPLALDGYALRGNYAGVWKRCTLFLDGIAAKLDPGSCIEYQDAYLRAPDWVPEKDWKWGWGAGGDTFVIFMGLTTFDEGEDGDALASSARGDKPLLKIPGPQVKFLRLVRQDMPQQKIVVVLTAGGPVDLREVSELADAIVLAWYPGEAGGEALADLLFGDADFTGRLPVTFVKDVAKLPPFEDYTMKGRGRNTPKDNVLYPFGYGLNYGKKGK